MSVPLRVAWFFLRNQGSLRVRDFLVAGTLLAVPFALIVMQPDLGTALLVFASGFCVIYFGGLSFRLLVPIAIVVVVAIGTLVYYETDICQPDVDWVVLHEDRKSTRLNSSH